MMIVELLVGTGITVGIIVVSFLIYRAVKYTPEPPKNESSCTGHHFETAYTYGRFQVYRDGRFVEGDNGERERVLVWVVKERGKERCQHEGCREERDRWVTKEWFENGLDAMSYMDNK